MNLEKVTLGTEMKTLGNHNFYNCHKLQEINFNENATTETFSKLETIGEACFQNCTSLQKLVTPRSLKTIGRESFLNCYNLDNIQLNEGLETLEVSCFANSTEKAATDTASHLQYIKIPESTTYIKAGVFQNNQNLQEVVVGTKDTKNGTLASLSLANCPSLKTIDFL